MMHLFLIIIFLFCSTSLFSQNSNDTNTVILQEVEVIMIVNPIEDIKTVCPIGELPIKKAKLKTHYDIILAVIENPFHEKIYHQNYSEFGLSIPAFRFEGINRMANTVAGVLSY